MNNLKTEINITEIIKDELNTNQVYAEISKDMTKKFFEEANTKTLDQNGRPSEKYENGEIQFIFNRKTRNLEEILIFPVFKLNDSIINGQDFIDAPDYVYNDKELIDFIKSKLI